MSAFFIRDYWNYYLELENEVISTKKYVEFSSDNYNVYSVEYLKLFQTICSEFETVGKLIAIKNNPNIMIKNNTNIYIWGYEIQKYFHGIESKSVCLNGPCYEIVPFANWKYKINDKGNIVLADGAKNLPWWKDHNDVKHGRMLSDSQSLNYKKANLKNVIYSLCALFVLERLYLANLGINGNDTRIIQSRLFKLLSDFYDN